MTKTNYRKYLTTRYLVTTSLITALLIVVSLLTIFIKFGNSSFQIADGLFLSLVPIIPGPMMLIVGLIYPTVFDLIGGGFIYIPLSIVIHLLMVLLIKILQRWWSVYLLFPISALLIFCYVPYNYWINLSLGLETAQSAVIRELIIDSIQFGLTVVLAIGFEVIFSRPHFKDYLQKKVLKMTESWD